MHVDQEFAVFNEYLEYRDGGLYWKKRPRKASLVFVGDRVGSLDKDGYRKFSLRGRYYREHRVIFFMHHMYWPTLIDHIDRDVSNNSIENLREATPKLNSRNSKRFNNFMTYRKGRDTYEVRYEGKYIGSSRCPMIARRLVIEACGV